MCERVVHIKEFKRAMRTVAARQVREKAVEVAGLLHAVPDRGELVGEVRAARLGPVDTKVSRQ